MSVDTEIEGSPSSITSVATWLRAKLAPTLSTAGDTWNSGRRKADASWPCEAGDEFRTLARRAGDKTEELEKSARTMANDLDAFAEKLRGCQNDMADIRDKAKAAKLTVTGFIIADPGAGPHRPPDNFVGTPEQVLTHNTRVTAYDDHQDLVLAYNHASSEAARIDRKYDAACRALSNEYTLGQKSAWVVGLPDLAKDSAIASMGVAARRESSRLVRAAEALESEARQAQADMRAHPERYRKRKWFFFKTWDKAKIAADEAKIAAKLDAAKDLRAHGQTAAKVKVPQVLDVAGKTLGAAGIGLGIYNDYRDGESTSQIVVSQGVSAGAGYLATVGTSMAVGAAVGTFVPIPVVGTVAGATVGVVVGIGMGAFSDGVVDSLFENGPDVSKAFGAGVDAVADTGGAIKSGVSSAGKAIGGWFS